MANGGILGVVNLPTSTSDNGIWELSEEFYAIKNNSWVVGDVFELISTQVLASTASSVTFSSISSAYKHLQLRIVGRDTAAVGQVAPTLQLNGDTGTNYSVHRVIGNGTSVVGFNSTSSTGILINSLPGASSATSIFGISIMDILDFSNTAKYKTVRMLGGNIGLNAEVGLNSGLWMNTSAVTSITITASTAFAIGSRFSLFGVRA